MNKFLYTLLPAVCAGALLSSCGSTEKAAPDSTTLMVSIEPLRYMAEQIVPEGIQVVSMMDRGANPETFDPTMARRLDADQSIAFVSTGCFPFEQSIRASLRDGVECIEVGEGMDFIYGTHEHVYVDEEHAHGRQAEGEGDEEHEHDADILPVVEADPHIWTSPRNMKLIAGNLADALVEMYPLYKSNIRKNQKKFSARMDSIDAAVSGKLAGAPHAFAVWHPSLSYFARDYGMEQIAVGAESKEVSPRRLKEIIDQAREDSVHVFFFQREYDSRQARSINEAIGSRLVTIDPLSYEWEEQLRLITDELAQ